MSNVFTVKINNLTFADFQNIYIKKSIENLCGISIFRTANIFLHSAKTYDIHFDETFEACINKTRLIKGNTDIINGHYDKTHNYIEIGGRDNTSILLDSCWDNPINEWKTQTILSIINTICTYFGISITVDPSATSALNVVIDSFKINEGEKVFYALKRLCLENQIMPISYGDGKLTLTSVSTNRIAYESLKTGNYRILKGVTKQSNVDRYNSYIVKGIGQETSFKGTSSYLQPYGKAYDNIVTDTNKKLVHLSETEIDFNKATNQASYLKNFRAGKSRIFIYDLKDWTQSNGELWQINTLVPIEDTFFRLKKQMLIYMIEYLYDKKNGFITKLFLVDKNTYTTNNVTIKTEFDA